MELQFFASYSEKVIKFTQTSHSNEEGISATYSTK